MNRIRGTATLATVALLLARRRPTRLEPPESAPASRPAVDADAPAPADRPGPADVSATPSDQAGRAGQLAGEKKRAPGPLDYKPKTSEGRVLGALGKAVVNSVQGDTAKQP
jgi:hypothetical protein